MSKPVPKHVSAFLSASPKPDRWEETAEWSHNCNNWEHQKSELEQVAPAKRPRSWAFRKTSEERDKMPRMQTLRTMISKLKGAKLSDKEANPTPTRPRNAKRHSYNQF